jgi:hypothetical protein
MDLSKSLSLYSMQMAKTVVSIFNNKTAAEFQSSYKEYLGNTTKLHTCKKDDIIILQNIEDKKVFGICQISEFSDGKIYTEHHLLGVDTYSGTDAKYNRYEIKIKNYKTVNISFDDLACICGKSADDTERTNIWKGSCFSFRQVNYQGPDSELVLKRLSIFLTAILTTTH